MIIGLKLMNLFNNIIQILYYIGYTTPSWKNQYTTPVTNPRIGDLIVVSNT